MRWLIVNSDYPGFLQWLYARHPGLEREAYETQMKTRMESLFGLADFYSSNLRRLGQEAQEVYANNWFLQRAWAKERGLRVESPGKLLERRRETLQRLRRMAARSPLKRLGPLFRKVTGHLDNPKAWMYRILGEQIKSFKPDILLNQNMRLDARFFREMKHHVRLLMGQRASTLPQGQDYGVYDLIISSLPNFVEYFRRQGLRSELHRLGFEPAILGRLGETGRSVGVSFVGSLSEAHSTRRFLLQYVCARIPTAIWGQGVETVPHGSPLKKSYRGNAWGSEMYRVLLGSRITLNHHIDAAENYANNMRLFEATGTGALLVTDWKRNLHEMFEVGKEVVAYRSPEECVELIQHYLEHETEREAVARAGQGRTLREHTYYRRMEELLEIVRRYL